MAETERVHVARLTLGYARQRAWGWALIGLATLAVSGVSLLQPWPMKLLADALLGDMPTDGTLSRIIDALPGADSLPGIFAWAAGLTLIIFALSSTLDAVLSQAWINVAQRMVYRLTEDVHDNALRCSLTLHRRRSVGDLMGRITVDTWGIYRIVDTVLLGPSRAVVVVLTIAALLVGMNPRLAVVALVAAPLTILPAYLSRVWIRKTTQDKREAETDLQSHVQRIISGMAVVQSFGTADREQLRFGRFTGELIDAHLRSTFVDQFSKLFSDLFTALGVALVTLLGAFEVLDGRMTVGSLLVFIAYFATLKASFSSLSLALREYQRTTVQVQRAGDLMLADRDVTYAPDAKPLPGRAQGALRFESVSFAYETNRPILDGIDLTVDPGQTLAIVGATGAGKSTLVGLVPRFYDPSNGRVLLDGHDLKSITLASLRRQVALVLQEAYLFPVSIAQNIAYARPDATPQQITDAAKAANAHGFINALPDGYDTVVGERGATLSGGERQRISIARALLCDSPVLILDEPTSALDALTEDAVVQATHTLMEGRTTLIIAHRLSTVRHADQIVVLDQGKIVEQGTHEQLVQLRGRYADMVDKQTLNPGNSATSTS